VAAQVALDQKANHEDFQGACQLVQAALDQKVDLPDLHEAIQSKADKSVLDEVRDIVDEKAALAEKASNGELLRVCRKVEQKADRSATLAAIEKWWVAFGLLASFVAAIAWQQQQIQNLSHQNNLLSRSLDKVVNLHDMSIQKPPTHFNSDHRIAQLLDNTVNNVTQEGTQLFQSGQIYDDTYTVELAPPFQNAWLQLDATMHTSTGTSGLVMCRGKADAFLAVDAKVLGFYRAGVEQWMEDISPDQSGLSTASTPGISNGRVASVVTEGRDDDKIVMTTTTTTASQPCMVVSLAFVEHHGRLTNVILSFKRDAHAKNGVGDGRIKSVRGKLQWFQQ